MSTTVKTQIKPRADLFHSVSGYDVSLETQEVTVKGTAPYDDVLERIKKTGKEVSMEIISEKLFLIDLRQVRSGEVVE